MKENTQQRIKRLSAQKDELLKRISVIREGTLQVRNPEHKMAGLNEEVMIVGERIVKLRR